MSHGFWMSKQWIRSRLSTSVRLAVGALVMACSDATGVDTEPLEPGGQSTGVIDITITSIGNPIDFDSDGYRLTVNNAGETIVGSVWHTTTANLPPGNHTLRLTGVAANCTVEGGSEKTLPVLAGRKSFAAFSVSCAPNLGSVNLHLTTIGPIPASTRFVATLPGIGAFEIASTAIRFFENVRAGAVTVTLAGVPGNCEVDGQNSLSVTIAYNVTTDIALTVRCVTPGGLKLIGSASGDDVSVGRTYAIEMTRAGTANKTYVSFAGDTTLAPLIPGVYSLNVLPIAPNCSTVIPNPREVTIPAGDPIAVGIQFACTRASTLAFIVYENDGPVIYSVNEIGGGLTRLVSGASAPSWSPDGKRIAFVDERDGYRLHVMDANGSNNIRLTPRVGLNPTWSPGGSQIAFEGLAGDVLGDRRQIFVVNADGSGEKRLFVTATSEFEPEWSPDGLQLVLTRGGGGIGGLWVMNVDGSGGRRLTERGADRNGTWSPDGKTIAFTRFEGQSSEIYLIDLHDNLTQLTHSSMSAAGPTWSPDGGKIAFGQYTRICPADFYYAATPCESGLFYSSLDGVTTRVPTPPHAYQPSWRR